MEGAQKYSTSYQIFDYIFHSRHARAGEGFPGDGPFLPAKTRLDRAQDITQHNYGEGSVFAVAVLVNCSQKKIPPAAFGFFFIAPSIYLPRAH